MDLTILPGIQSPADLKALDLEQLPILAAEMRQEICSQVQQTGGHLAPQSWRSRVVHCLALGVRLRARPAPL